VTRNKPGLLIVFLVIVLDLVGFGIMVPILAYYAVQLGGGAELATLCMALYPIGMFISTPILGRLSDYYGRKPILMISMVGAIFGYLLLGFAQSLWLVALSRFVAGLMSGNIAAAQAYVTDVTSEQDRARGMGLIGAGFGLGFIIGPALGSWLAGDDFASANLVLPAIVSAGMCFAALLAIVFLLQESLEETHRQTLRDQPHPGRLTALRRLWRRPLIPHFLAVQSAFAALTLTSMQSLVSKCAGPTERGMLMGVYSAAGTLGRIVGTLVTGSLFAYLHIHSPYASCVLLMCCVFLVARSVESHWKRHVAD